MIEQLQLGTRTLNLPLIQGGMGVGISLGNLAGHVMKEGAMGVISAAHPGYRKDTFWQDACTANIEALHEEVTKAKQIAQGKGLCGVNIMVASHHYEDYVKAAVAAKADAIISGAGIPLDLPKYVDNHDILLAPIVSSAKVARLILKAWDRHAQRIPDFIVIEGALAGGHLGFRKETLLSETYESNETILAGVLAELKPYEERYGHRVPVFVAGGIYDGADIAHIMAKGASGVQMATRFIATEECDASEAYKKAFLHAGKEDIHLVSSPAGLPGRAIDTAFTKKIQEKRIPPHHCIGCMKPCKPDQTPYCISEALIQAVTGNLEEGLVFAGTNAYRIQEITTVSELIATLMQELEDAQ